MRRLRPTSCASGRWRSWRSASRCGGGIGPEAALEGKSDVFESAWWKWASTRAERSRLRSRSRQKAPTAESRRWDWYQIGSTRAARPRTCAMMTPKSAAPATSSTTAKSCSPLLRGAMSPKPTLSVVTIMK